MKKKKRGWGIISLRKKTKSYVLLINNTILNNMSSRQEELSELQNYIKEVDKEVTMILQSLQWDRKHLLQCKPKNTCKFDSNHKVPPEKLKEHEAKCDLKCQGYTDDDIFLPDVFDANSNTVLKLSSENIKDIINYASKTDPVFIRVHTNDHILLALKICDGNVVSEPLTMERLQAAYTADERRAIYDVVIHSRPSCDELADLPIGEVGGPSVGQNRSKSKLERLAELRDMRRRRTKYRVPVRSRNYSHTLRELIDAQMEMYTEAQEGHTKSKSLDGSEHTYRKVKEEQSDKRVDNSSDGITIEHREIKKERKDTYDTDRRNSYSDNKRKRDSDDRSSRKFEKGRYQYSTEEREKQYDNYRKQERKRDNYREEIEKDLHQRSTKEKGKHYSSDRRRQERKRDSYREETEKDIYSSSKEERGKYYSSDSRQGKKRDSYREGLVDSRKYDTNSNVEKNRIYIKEERDSSSSRDTHRYRESEREERCYKDRSTERRRNDSEHKIYYHAHDQYKKEKEHCHTEKRKHED